MARVITEDMRRDHGICMNIWYLIRDFGDIEIGQDDRWAELVKRADEAGRKCKYKEERTLITMTVLAFLEDRAKRKAREKELAKEREEGKAA